MCGIAGIIRFDAQPMDTDRLAAMQRALACRGPDDAASHLEGPCGLAHTRLAVLDIDHGAQPMQRGHLTVIYNGEIYNHHALRRELESLGHTFTTDHSDTEVLLHGYRQWGAQLLRRLEGMFALVVWDAEQRTLVAARDRMGQKPLFIRRGNESITFASTVAALLVGGTIPPINHAAMCEYLTFGYTCSASLIEGVEELPPAHSMTITHDGRVDVRRYFSPPAIASRTDTAGLAELLREAVVHRLEADVPLGCFLSGGIDSSLVAAFAQHHLQQRGERLKTFCVAMPDAAYDESPWARQVADHLGTEHHELTAEPDVEADLQHLIATMGEPLADSSILPTYWVSRAARRHVTVALSGDGGDELFAGYERYRAMQLCRRYRFLLSQCMVPHLLGRCRVHSKSRLDKLRRLHFAARHRAPAEQYRSIVAMACADMLEMKEAPLDDWPEAADPADAARRWDLEHYLPGDLLRKVDRASMAVGLEVRSPMLDRKVVEAVAALPAATLMPRGRIKGLLRRLAEPYLPRDITRRRKMGFAIPLARWFEYDLRPVLERHLLDAPHLANLGFKRPALERLIRQHMIDDDVTHELFALLALSMWHGWLTAR